MLHSSPESSSNPFEILNRRLSSIENILSDFLQNQPSPITEKEEDDYVELTEAAKILHISPSRLYVIHKKIFNIRKPGKKVLFSRKELDAYLDGTLQKKAESFVKNISKFKKSQRA